MKKKIMSALGASILLWFTTPAFAHWWMPTLLQRTPSSLKE
ncbi:MAG TPA: hypothetical protein VFG09_03270 [Thermodesulfovibrionales bacterium]|nr:hypothetical protein [Thermodesulfovibrionales bacterium]